MIRSILVGVSAGTDTDTALDWAAAKAKRRGLPVRLVHAVPWIAPDPFGAAAAFRDEVIAQGRTVLRTAADRVRQSSPEVEVTELLDDETGPVTALLRHADSAEMIVLGSKGRTVLGDLVASSATLGTISRTQLPVVVVPAGAAQAAGPVVVGVDGSHLSDRAVEMAFLEASTRGTSLTAITSWQEPSAWTSELAAYGVLTDDQRRQIQQGHRDTLADVLAPWQDKYPDVAVERRVVEGHPGRVLVAASHGAGLLVVGSRGRGGFTGLLLGSVSSAAVHHATCPVMVCHD